MNFLGLNGKAVLVLGAANRKSVAWHVDRVLRDAGAIVLHSVRSEQRRESLRKLLGDDAPIFVCDVERQEEIDRLRSEVGEWLGSEIGGRKAEVGEPRSEVGDTAPTGPCSSSLHGIVHSIAFADYSAGWLPFHETPRAAFLQAVDVSCFSLVAVANAFKDLLDKQTGSVVTISISTTRMAAENYGYMAPVKAALDSAVCFLAKSFAEIGHVRFNAVGPGLLKSSASAGIPGYVESYLFAEKGNAPQIGREDRRSRQRRRVPVVASLQRHQRPASRDRCGDGDQLLRSRDRGRKQTSRMKMILNRRTLAVSPHDTLRETEDLFRGRVR